MRDINVSGKRGLGRGCARRPRPRGARGVTAGHGAVGGTGLQAPDGVRLNTRVPRSWKTRPAIKTGVASSQRQKPVWSLGMQIGVQPGPWSPRESPSGPWPRHLVSVWCPAPPVPQSFQVEWGGGVTPLCYPLGQKEPRKQCLSNRRVSHRSLWKGCRAEKWGWGAYGVSPRSGPAACAWPTPPSHALACRVPPPHIAPPPAPQSLSSQTREGARGKDTFTNLTTTPVTVCHVSGCAVGSTAGWSGSCGLCPPPPPATTDNKTPHPHPIGSRFRVVLDRC